MSEIKALGKLRNCYFPSDTPGVHNEALAIADEIQAEVASKFMELPMGADGELVCIGDVVAAQDEQPFEVRAFQIDTSGWYAIERLGSKWNVNRLHHVKPRTLEDVLEEFVRKSVEPISNNREANLSDIAFCIDKDKMDKYAAEIRELLGGDAE